MYPFPTPTSVRDNVYLQQVSQRFIHFQMLERKTKVRKRELICLATPEFKLKVALQMQCQIDNVYK